ncbi:unnamed protein product [Amoebophrya sp. A120]|nr:unnamed protein product [Amoebophrya sp. A120]|eukprot:GSA120T00002803001.1
MEAARRGEGFLSVTAEVLAAAPLSTRGKRVEFIFVAGHRKLPFKIEWEGMGERFYSTREIFRMDQMRRFNSLDKESLPEPSMMLSGPKKVLVDAINAGCFRACEYIMAQATKAFAAGSPEYVLTEEEWNGAPRLPNGDLPPLFARDLHEMLGGPLLADHVQGVARLLFAEDDLKMSITEAEDWDEAHPRGRERRVPALPICLLAPDFGQDSDDHQVCFLLWRGRNL